MLYQGQLQEYFQNLFNSYTSLIKSFGAGKKVFEYLDRVPRCQRPEKKDLVLNLNFQGTATHSPPVKIGDIMFENVSFAYPSRPEVPVLENLSMTVKQGQMVALVGPSGAGKSTIFHLLQHFYDPDNGDIRIGNLNLRDYDHHKLHKDFAIVGQEPTLMSGTIEDNILYGIGGMDTFTDEQKVACRDMVTNSAKLANAHDFICELPNGYQTDVGEKGVQLSGGKSSGLRLQGV